MRRRKRERYAENQSTARITSPCSQFLGRPPVSMNCQIVTTASPVAAMTRIPGHHAQKPAKKPQKGPSAFCVQTYSEPSCGNMSPSCAVTSTRGSMPGAIRSEIIWRSSAGATAAIHHLRVGCAGIFALEARFDQEPGEERRAHGDGVEEDVLVARVRSAALSAEPVEHRDAERAHEIAVGAAARGALVE